MESPFNADNFDVSVAWDVEEKDEADGVGIVVVYNNSDDTGNVKDFFKLTSNDKKCDKNEWEVKKVTGKEGVMGSVEVIVNASIAHNMDKIFIVEVAMNK